MSRIKPINQVKALRSKVFLRLRPSKKYWLATKNLKPLSKKFGFDRGTPIDRFWIESFLKENKKHIKGVCLEIGDNIYILKFGQRKVITSDILDIDRKNEKANIIGDLRNLKKVIKDNTYDCIILTHVLGMIDDYHSAISELKRILKPGGTLLLTTSCFSPAYSVKTNFWRFTTASARYVFEKHFSKNSLKVKSYGNVLAGQCFWVGMSQEELTRDQLEYNDPHFPCVVAVYAIKEKS